MFTKLKEVLSGSRTVKITSTDLFGRRVVTTKKYRAGVLQTQEEKIYYTNNKQS